MRFSFKRIHSLLGLVPIGAFLLLHFSSNSYIFISETAFNNYIFLNSLSPLTYFYEIFLIGLPLLFHVGLGLVLMQRGEQNFSNYNYLHNWFYFLQRVTGLLALVFIVAHVYTMRVKFLMIGETVAYHDIYVKLANPYWLWFYVVGLVATTFHFSNGVRSGLITWGLTVGQKSQQMALGITAFLFLGLTLWGIAILIQFT
jgi:succinate dehydrogenase / fumarate reductase, cytochrome b subunit